jgi:hypothetical protein
LEFRNSKLENTAAAYFATVCLIDAFLDGADGRERRRQDDGEKRERERDRRHVDEKDGKDRDADRERRHHREEPDKSRSSKHRSEVQFLLLCGHLVGYNVYFLLHVHQQMLVFC